YLHLYLYIELIYHTKTHPLIIIHTTTHRYFF
ncbi:hypothetical protein RB653_005667, partial [Dictyostelium firmibasis]